MIQHNKRSINSIDELEQIVNMYVICWVDNLRTIHQKTSYVRGYCDFDLVLSEDFPSQNIRDILHDQFHHMNVNIRKSISIPVDFMSDEMHTIYNVTLSKR